MFSEPDCPNLLDSILANIYKKQKRYARFGAHLDADL